MNLFGLKSTEPQILSDRAKEILSDRKLTEELLKAIRAERSNGEFEGSKIISVVRVETAR